MVELRDKIPGFYKGLVYCSSIQEAEEISEYLSKLIKENINRDLSPNIKRGCSEYYEPFPEYNKPNLSNSNLMTYKKVWKQAEIDYDKRNKKIEKNWPTQPGFTLSDYLIIRNWFAYAQGIGDKSVSWITTEEFFANENFRLAKRELVATYY